MKKVTLTKNQGVFLEKVAKIIEDDPKLIGFCKNRASGVTFVLKVIDNYIEDKYKGKPIKDGEVYINSKLLKILNKDTKPQNEVNKAKLLDGAWNIKKCQN